MRGLMFLSGWKSRFVISFSKVSPSTWTTRSVIQSSNYSSLLTETAARAEEQLQLRRKSHGRHYRNQRHLWNSCEEMEIGLTHELYGPLEREGVALLEHRRFSEPPHALPDATNQGTRERSEDSPETPQLPPPRTAAERIEQRTARRVVCDTWEERHEGVDRETDHGDVQSVAELIASEHRRDLDGTALASFHPPRALLSTRDGFRNALRQTRHVRWHSLGLDPLLSHLASRRLGPYASATQARVLPALLHEDHHDVICSGGRKQRLSDEPFVGPPRGLTSALVLAALQGTRSESAGVNVVVASSRIDVKRVYDMVLNFCGRHGGAVVDRAAEDTASWLMQTPFLEEARTYAARIRQSANSATASDGAGLRLLITTAETLCEIIFVHKVQFAPFGYLRRLYVDDAAKQISMLSPHATTKEAKERVANPRAVELLLASAHQLPSPAIRSILQIALVDDDIPRELKHYLLQLCVKPAPTRTLLVNPTEVPRRIHVSCSFFTLRDVSEKRSRVATPYPNFQLDGDRNIVIPVSSWCVPLVTWLRAATPTIAGRALIFVHGKEDLISRWRQLRAEGLDVKLLSEVSSTVGAIGGDEAEGTTRGISIRPAVPWKFLLLRESDSMAVSHFPLVSHVFITFAPTSRYSFYHMAVCCVDDAAAVHQEGKEGHDHKSTELSTRDVVDERKASTLPFGWVHLICPRAEAPLVEDVLSEHRRSLRDCTFRVDDAECFGGLERAPAPRWRKNAAEDERTTRRRDRPGAFPSIVAVAAAEVDRMVAPCTPIGLEPPAMVDAAHEHASECVDLQAHQREFFLHPRRDFVWQGDARRQVPLAVLERRRRRVRAMERAFENDPSVAASWVEEGWLDEYFAPTSALQRALREDDAAPTSNGKKRSLRGNVAWRTQRDDGAPPLR